MPKPILSGPKVGLNSTNNSVSYMLMNGSDFGTQETIQVQYPANVTNPTIIWTGTATPVLNGGGNKAYVFVALTAAVQFGGDRQAPPPGDLDDVSVTATNSDNQTSDPITVKVQFYNT